MKRKFLSVIMACIMLIGLVACGEQNNTPTVLPSEENNSQTEEKVLVLPQSAEPPNMDPQTSTDVTSHEIHNGVLEGLIRIKNQTIVNGMAESYTISDDGLIYTFKIREDAKWNDGISVTANDFEYSIKRLINPETAAEYAYQAYYIKGAEEWNTGVGSEDEVGVRALDEKTLEITLKTPTEYFLSLLSFGAYLPSRKDIVEKYGQSYASDYDKMVYNGPFVIEKWTHEEEVILTKNEAYWNKEEIKLDKVEMPIITEASTRRSMYEDGSLDYTALDKDGIDIYSASGEIEYFYDGGVFYFEVNVDSSDDTKRALLQNINFRKALSVSIDRNLFTEAVLKDGSDAALRYVLPLISGVESGKTYAQEHPYEAVSGVADINLAKEYLEMACKQLSTSVDKLPTIELLCDDSESARIRMEALQAMAKEVGIKLEIKQVPFKQRLELMTNRNYDIVFSGWGPDYNDAMTYMDLWLTESGNNHTGWSDEEYDNLVKGAVYEVDSKKRSEMLFEAETILLEEAAVIPIYFRRVAYLQKDYVVNLQKSFYGATRDYVYADIVK